MIKWIYQYVANLKRFWWELDKEQDLINILTFFQGHIFLRKNSDKNTKNAENYKIQHLQIDWYGTINPCSTFEVILMITWFNQKLWHFFLNHIFLSKITEKTPQNAEHHKIYQLEITHILIGMIQWIHVADFKWIWWDLELHRKIDLRYIDTVFEK